MGSGRDRGSLASHRRPDSAIHYYSAITLHHDRRALRVCVCVFVPSTGGSPSVKGKTCATLCSESGGLHLFSVLFWRTIIEPTGVTQEGVNTGAFPSFYVSLPHTPAVLAFIFYREEGSAVT